MAGRETAGRKVFVGEPSKTIREFCEHERLSKSKYYDLRKRGLGPAEIRVGSVIRITPQAHVAWRERHTEPP